MSAWRLVVLECDGGGGFGRGCDQQWRSTSDDADQARRDAARMGWTYDEDDNTDYCSNHGKA